MKVRSTDPVTEYAWPVPCNEQRTGRPTIASISMDALASNFREVANRIGSRDILAVVKANAYGHGAVQVAQRFCELGTTMLGVALVEEGSQLRAAGITCPILVMGAVFPDQADEIVALNLTPVVFTEPVVRAISRAASKRNVIASVHVKIDTGMGRIGVACSHAAAFIESAIGLGNISVRGLMTHFADADLVDKRYAMGQMGAFENVINNLAEKGVDIPVRHAANSAAVLDFHDALFTMVRPGLMLYGYNPLASQQVETGLVPALSLVTKIAYLKKVPAGTFISYGRTFTTHRESLIATLPIGYADGFNRLLSNRGDVLVRGLRAPIAGRVCMDMCMIDVTDVPGVEEGDDVVLIGRQGGERITADDLAVKTGTIAYEVLCGISSRVPRIYQ